MINKIIKESLLSLLENKRKNIFFLLFISMAMTTASIISSSIESVRKQAESELKITGENIITVDFTGGISEGELHNLERYIHEKMTREIGKMKRVILYSGEYPWGNYRDQFLGVNEVWLRSVPYLNDIPTFLDNELITMESGVKNKSWYVNHISFDIIKHYNLAGTTFLSSLGLDGDNSSGDNLIPFKTAVRYAINNDVDSIRLIFSRPVNESDVQKLNKKISEIKDNYKITSILSARLAVDNVINNFSLLYISTYVVLLMLNIMVSFSTIKRNFLERKIELSLKVIYGLKPVWVLLQFVLESIYLNLFVLIISIFSSLTISYVILNYYLNVAFVFSVRVLFFFFVSSLLSSFISCLLYTRKISIKSPVYILKEITS
ncbi:hypothetical protein PZC96_002847 [Salmonella enterica]|nr:hypothetical protein [Salmonella enterica]